MCRRGGASVTLDSDLTGFPFVPDAPGFVSAARRVSPCVAPLRVFSPETRRVCARRSAAPPLDPPKHLSVFPLVHPSVSRTHTNARATTAPLPHSVQPHARARWPYRFLTHSACDWRTPPSGSNPSHQTVALLSHKAEGRRAPNFSFKLFHCFIRSRGKKIYKLWQLIYHQKHNLKKWNTRFLSSIVAKTHHTDISAAFQKTFYDFVHKPACVGQWGVPSRRRCVGILIHKG